MLSYRCAKLIQLRLSQTYREAFRLAAGVCPVPLADLENDGSAARFQITKIGLPDHARVQGAVCVKKAVDDFIKQEQQVDRGWRCFRMREEVWWLHTFATRSREGVTENASWTWEKTHIQA